MYNRKYLNIIALLFIFSFIYPADLHFNEDSFSIRWLIPFLGILLSIAIVPLINPSFWHHHYGKISAFWGILFFLCFAISFSPQLIILGLLEVYLHEFLPFIMLLLALFIVSGGILIEGKLVGSPKLNFIILFIGTILASIMGTTGASMLLIRPIIRANHWRKNKLHIIIFFIFLISNIGGSLTPIGDPPLFLGYLKGVDFFWTIKYMALPMIIVSSLLLILFVLIDSYYFKKEKHKSPNTENLNISIKGKFNFILILVIIGAVLLSGSESLKHSFFIGPNGFINYPAEIMTNGILIQILILSIVSLVSWKFTSKGIRSKNVFTWEPIKEVGKLFATIFLTMLPAITMLKSFNKENSPLHFLSKLINDDNGSAITSMYFWLTGILSSFLDNAPTYVVFFSTAKTNLKSLAESNDMTAVEALMDWDISGGGGLTLLAISCGAVFMGAMTYIGNAPNFMVKSIAEENDIKMPSFFGFMLYSVLILMPIFVLIDFLFF